MADTGPSYVPPVTATERRFGYVSADRPAHGESLSRVWFTVALVGALAAHIGLIAVLLLHEPDQKPPSQQEVVVELVTPPKPPAPAVAKPPPPQPAPRQQVEKPATSAPRAANDSKVEAQARDKETRAPKAPVPPAAGQPQQQAPNESKPAPTEPDRADTQSAETAPDESEKKERDEPAKPDILQKDAEALAKAKPRPEKPKKLAKATPKARPHRTATALQRLAGASALPDYTFARPAKKAPVSGGDEDARYLAIVYGMIMRHRTPIVAPGGGGTVTIVFEVDDDGNVIGLSLRSSSGFPELDAEAARAIQRASPLPPPPPGAPHSLVAKIDFGEGGAVDP
jgi:protein TonB